MWYLKDVKLQDYAWMEILSKEQCESIVSNCLSRDLEAAKTGYGQGQTTGNSIRKSKVAWLSMDPGSAFYDLYRACESAVNAINGNFFNYDLLGIETLQFAAYDSAGSHFGKHVDNALATPTHRKLTFSIQLSDEKSYEGGDLLLHTGNIPTAIPRTQGVISFFPSYTLHEVTPIISGTRYSLVGWCHGPRFK
jgi:PKHD-type hydroxylase